MPARITNFIPGSCFGYCNESNKECNKCKLFESCKNATSSNEVEEVRKIFKTTVKVID